MGNLIFNKSNDYRLQTPLFSITNTHVVFHSKQQELQFDLNLISNVRLIKNRVFYINILLTGIGVLCYFGITIFFELFPSPYYFPFFLIAILYFSFLYKQFSYKLLINKQYLAFHELKVSPKNITHAQYFIALYKKSCKK